MVSPKEISAHAFQVSIQLVFTLKFCHFSHCMDQREGTKEFYFPFIFCVLVEQILFAPDERLTKHHWSGGKLPFISVLILKNQESAVLRCIVQTADITCLWINLRPIFTGCTVSLVAQFMCWEVIQIHLTYVRVISK